MRIVCFSFDTAVVDMNELFDLWLGRNRVDVYV